MAIEYRSTKETTGPPQLGANHVNHFSLLLKFEPLHCMNVENGYLPFDCYKLGATQSHQQYKISGREKPMFKNLEREKTDESLNKSQFTSHSTLSCLLLCCKAF